jgi:hypothetical protein
MMNPHADRPDSLSLWRNQAPQPLTVDRQSDRRRRCARCRQPVEGRPLPRQLAALSLLKLPLCHDCYLDVEASASSFGESGRAFEERLFGKLASLAAELEFADTR